ncbi:hypothetical protein DCAR_0934158 [Daucus carota subsp. sativus]|uniref:Uncharacterized protein n=1 Tax=Daucus carota subsp. sativus TaxID=79200 RepID=A0A175YFS1_DAUCS|nr:hypothetical protein DCAR_0934158 [Daucus carota subsp. sativus]
MAYHWIPPTQGTLKINVHGTYSTVPSDAGNTSGLGVVFLNSTSSLRHVTVGTISFLSRLGVQLWAICVPLRHALLKRCRSVVLATDNLEAFRVIRDFNLGASASVYDIISQIDILIKDRRWTCTISYVVPARNHVARFVALLGKDLTDRLYTLNKMIGPMEELLN